MAADIQNVQFETADGFLKWLKSGGKRVVMPYHPDTVIKAGEEIPENVWYIIWESGKSPVITSGYFSVMPNYDQYGMPQTHGHLYKVGDKGMASGIIRFNKNKKGKLQIFDRKRIGENQSIQNGDTFVAVTLESAPDRLQEPVAVILSGVNTEDLIELSSEDWLKLYDEVRDGTEMVAVRELRRFAGVVKNS